MADAAGRISTLQIRCPCGKSFENTETYLGHKKLCRTHHNGEHVISVTPNSSQRAAAVPTRVLIPASTPRLMPSVTCRCSSRFKNHNKIHGHECQRAVHEQQVNARWKTLNLARHSGLYQVAGPTLATEKHPIPPAETTAQKILCPCGQSFKNEKKLKNHLRYSKTHQAEKSRSGSTPKSTTPDPVPFTASHSPSTTISPALWPVSTTIPSSVLPKTSPISCTCSPSFEPEQAPQAHKCDCLYYRRQADKSLTRSQQPNDSLVSSFVSLRLDPVLTQAEPLVASFACMCGSTFTSQKALEKHKVEKRQLAWPEKGEKRKDIFKTPRLQYHEDEYLRDMCEALARQSYG